MCHRSESVRTQHQQKLNMLTTNLVTVSDRNRETLLKRLVRYVRDFLIHIFETDDHLKAWIEMLKEELDQLPKDNSFEELVSEKKNNNLYEKNKKKLFAIVLGWELEAIHIHNI